VPDTFKGKFRVEIVSSTCPPLEIKQDTTLFKVP
jgi:hypothetical protein